VRSIPFIAAFDDGRPIGFVAIKIHNSYTVEVYVMGILSEYHRQGVGAKLIEFCENYCAINSIEFLTVKTLDESGESESYRRTRLFYLKMGFRPLEVFPFHWDEDNPCLFMAKSIDRA
jgi:GNAT superfamily N-acetyltransferase